jgi:hypothetical protein
MRVDPLVRRFRFETWFEARSALILYMHAACSVRSHFQPLRFISNNFPLIAMSSNAIATFVDGLIKSNGEMQDGASGAADEEERR